LGDNQERKSMAAHSLSPDQVANYEAFYRASYERVFRTLALTVNSTDLGRDAADEAFTRAIERWPEVSEYDNQAGWAYRVGYNWAITRLRWKHPKLPPGMTDSVHHDRVPDPEFGPAIAALPVDQRAVIILRYSTTGRWTRSPKRSTSQQEPSRVN